MLAAADPLMTSADPPVCLPIPRSAAPPSPQPSQGETLISRLYGPPRTEGKEILVGETQPGFTGVPSEPWPRPLLVSDRRYFFLVKLRLPDPSAWPPLPRLFVAEYSQSCPGQYGH
ncbi:hypothetical protein E2C01_069373 [Portunus trituberculatus]|uniref:Uncharacterized protein n=1 Tax=Portunus trituberculatus TaxID=210409 RepID=A0A5B7HRE4_PORTR|nr:hypothetical protein [Portunus trituberculatus]